MDKLKVSLKNCYGIQSLDRVFDFDLGSNPDKPKRKAYAIYAPNGLMKTSFSKPEKIIEGLGTVSHHHNLGRWPLGIFSVSAR